MRCTLQKTSGEILHILKEAFIELTLGWRPLTTLVFVANVTDEFILGLKVRHTHNASVDLRCQVL
jgi:hypothetical protein